MISFQSESLRHLNNTLMDWAPDNERDRANRSAVMSENIPVPYEDSGISQHGM